VHSLVTQYGISSARMTDADADAAAADDDNGNADVAADSSVADFRNRSAAGA